MSEANGATTAPNPQRRGWTERQSPSVMQDISRTLPHSVEAEQGVLGSMLISPREIIAEVQEKISDEHFYVPAHQTIYIALLELHDKGQGIDLITFTQVLRDRNLLDTVGGAGFVTSLFTFVPTAANVTYYLEIVRDKFILRQLIAYGTEIVRRGFEEQDEVNALVDEAQQKITSLGLDAGQESPVQQISAAVDEVIEDFSVAFEHRGRTQGLATGFVDLDRMTNGLHPSEMIVVAARPSMGKTALAMNIAEHVVMPRFNGEGDMVYNGTPVLVFSLETSRVRLVRRMICGMSRVSLQRIRDGFMKEEDIPRITRAAELFKPAKIYIDETPGLRLFEYKARARRAWKKYGIGLIVIDYLQLLRAPSKRAEFSRIVELTDVSMGVKEIGRELNIPTLVLAQLNREAEKTDSGRPRMSHLRECGALEQDADLVALLHRKEYYAVDEAAKREVEGEAELIIAKQKDGPVGSIYLTFLKEFTRFEDRATSDGSARPMYSNNRELRQWVE